MGVVPVMLIPNQHITILQFVILTKQQIAEELHEERLVWLYSFLRNAVVDGIEQFPLYVVTSFVKAVEEHDEDVLENGIEQALDIFDDKNLGNFASIISMYFRNSCPRSSSSPFCFPATLHDWQGGPPMKPSQSGTSFGLMVLRSANTNSVSG